jgi:hypothetical protein
MQEEIKKVLEMLEEGKISKDEAVKLIEAIKETNNNMPNEEVLSKNGKRFLRVRISKDGKGIVNVKLPLSLVGFGLTIAKKAGKNTLNIDGEEIPFDFDEVKKAINDPEFSGKIVDVTEEGEGKHIEVEIA